MKTFSRFTFWVLMIVQLYACKSQNDIIISTDGAWKFKTGDSLAYALPEFDDSSWDSISPNTLWELQGYENYDGFAWYRLHFFLPEEMKANAFLKDSIQIIIGKIDDTDETYLNGEVIGQNGITILTDKNNHQQNFTGKTDTYRILRRYVLSVNDPRIQWNKENVLAVRVHDHGGGGGIYSDRHEISMLDLKEYLSITSSKNPPQLTGKNLYQVEISMENLHREITFDGKLSFRVVATDKQQTIYDTIVRVTLAPSAEQTAMFHILADQTNRHQFLYSFKEKKSGKVFSGSGEMPYILTPPPPEVPRINGPKVLGVRPGNDFLFYIPVTGLRPINYKVTGLPAGLKIDTSTGIISGKIASPGEYPVKIEVENRKGKDQKEIRIIAGNTIALTPPMGWNSWNCWGLSVDDAKVKAAADQFVETGLIDHGWTYINIDDGWEAPKRKSNGEIIPNEKFPDMKSLTDYVHSKGLKMGIYSSPGPQTCGGYLGSYQHECQDAQTYARWGIDYLKYDWCSYGQIAKDNSLEELKKPYLLMRNCLDKAGRDILFSLCQYGMGEVWQWGAEVGGNCWRTTGDIEDTWESMSGIGFSQDVSAPYIQPGHWNDPDMLVVGWVGWGPRLHPTRLTPSEQYTHISLWSLLSAPLLIGCDLNRLDAFTLNLLTNDEVLAVNQDPAAKPAFLVIRNDKSQIWAKPLDDGSIAVGLFNTSFTDANIELNFSGINVQGKQKVRDLWRQKDLGIFTGSYESKVPAHGVVFIKLSAE